MTCPSCGARTAEGVQWCGLCLQPLGAGNEVAATTTAPEVMTGSPATAPLPPWVRDEEAARAAAEQAWEALAGRPAAARHTPAPEPGREHSVSGETGRFLGEHRMVVLDTGEAGWVCRLCERAQPLTEGSCPACATSLFSVEAERGSRPTGDPTTALLWSVIPGAGQWYLGLRAQALARASLVLISLAAAVSFPPRGALGAMRLATALLCALLWIVSAIDARAVARQGVDAALLTDRRLMWVALGVTVLLVGAVVLALLMGTVSGGAGAGVGAGASG